MEYTFYVPKSVIYLFFSENKLCYFLSMTFICLINFGLAINEMMKWLITDFYIFLFFFFFEPGFSCSKLTIETLKQSVKYVQS